MAATGKNSESDMFVLDMATTSAALGKVYMTDEFVLVLFRVNIARWELTAYK